MPDPDLGSPTMEPPRFGIDLTEKEYRIFVSVSSVSCGLFFILVLFWGSIQIDIKRGDILSWAQLTGAMAGFGIAILALLNEQGRFQHRLRMLVASSAVSLTFATLSAAIAFLKSPDREVPLKVAFVSGGVFFLAFGLGNLVTIIPAASKYKHLSAILDRPFVMSPLLIIAFWPTSYPLLAYTVVLSIGGFIAASASVTAFAWVLVRPRLMQSTVSQSILRTLLERRQRAQKFGEVTLVTFKDLENEIFSNKENIRPSLESLVAQDAIIRISTDQYWLLDKADLGNCLSYVDTKALCILPAMHTLGDLVTTEMARATGVPEEVISRFFESAILNRVEGGRQVTDLGGCVMVAAPHTLAEIADRIGPSVRDRIKSGIVVSEDDLAREALQTATCLPDLGKLSDSDVQRIGAYVAESEPFCLSCADDEGTAEFLGEMSGATIVLESNDLLARCAAKRGLPERTNVFCFARLMEPLFTPTVNAHLQSSFEIDRIWLKRDQAHVLAEIYSDLVKRYGKYFDAYVLAHYAESARIDELVRTVLIRAANKTLSSHADQEWLAMELTGAISAIAVPMIPSLDDGTREHVWIAIFFDLHRAMNSKLAEPSFRG